MPTAISPTGGADDPFTKYYIAALCALRGEGEHERAIRYLGETLGSSRP